MTESDRSLEEKLIAVYKKHISGYIQFKSLERLSGGASQETYRILIETDQGEVVHAMRRAAGGETGETVEGRPGLVAEANLMRAAKAAGVPEPEVYYVLQAEDGIGDGFIMQWLEGEALGARIVRSDKFENLRPTLSYECGKLMARIHNIDLDSTGLRDQLTTVSPKAFVEQTWNSYIEFNSPHPMIDYAGRWLMEHLPKQDNIALVHNDFRNGNFMVDEKSIVAVLDWELAHIGDPMRDLGWICVNSWRFGADKPVGGFGDYADLYRGYEEVSGIAVDPEAVKFWQVFGSFWWAVGCLGMAEHYRNGPDKTVERPAIGRRSSECQVDCINLLFPGETKLVSSESSSDDPISNDSEMPRVDELLSSVRDFLRGDVMSETSGRTQFMARVAANSLDIAIRDQSLGELAKLGELSRLQAFYQSGDSLSALRWKLVKALRDGTQSLDDKTLQFHLRQTAANQLAIDQPKYSGLREVLSAV